MKFTDVEKEIIFLKAITELIDSMVNLEMFDLSDDENLCEVRFKSITHQQHFNTLLLNFLSRPDSKVLGEKRTYLELTETICQSPNFNNNNSVKNLSISTQEFADWIEQEIQVEIWLPSIDSEATLSPKRTEFIKMCGNTTKHNFSSLSGTANELIGIFKRNSLDITFEEALLVLDDFYQRFHYNLLKYHGGTIAEFLNNIRWGIYEYLQPEFQQSIVYEEAEHPQTYHYTYPDKINDTFARNCYWDLMNEVGSEPSIRRFQVSRCLKTGY
jgi:hypothetical protein